MNYFKPLKLPILLISIFIHSTSFAQLTVTPGSTAAALAAKLAGPGITISSPVLTCASVANGTFVSTATPLTIDSGIILCTGRAVQASGPESFLASTSNGTPGDPTLAALAMATTYDACALEFDFTPNGDTVRFNYQFGSEEYNHSTCGPYNDAFAFFISGPGITGTQNMALIPGTTIPVTVNSVNSGIPGAGYTLANCTSMGPGSPFTSYFYDNTGGTQLTYKGYTIKMTAIHDVIPCNVYHLKMAICDAGNRFYDSGVFIEAGSLSTNTFSFDHIDSIGHTINGVANTIVKGCTPATVKVHSSHATGHSQTVHFSYGGSAIQNVDFTGPDSATIATGADSVLITITGIPTIPAGTKTLELYLLSPFSCGIVDSVAINILDSPSADIITPDTTICSGSSFQIRTTGTTGLAYNWTPATGLSSAVAMQPIATPSATTTYTMTANLPNSGCADIVDSINVTVINTSISITTPNTTICLGGSVNLNVTGSTTNNYNWSPATGLNSSTIQNPVATPTVTTTYTVTSTGPGGICPETAAVTITVGIVNTTLLTPDTTICLGASFTMRVTGTSGPTYSWTPAAGLSNASIMNPVASPTVTTDYVFTASWPGSGCPSYNSHVVVTVEDATISLLTGDTTICAGNNVNIRLTGSPSLNYSWTPATGLNNAAIADPVATPATTTAYSVTAVSADGLCTSQASLVVMVANSAINILTNDPSICKGSSVFLNVEGDSSMIYNWSPSYGLSDPNVKQPIASPGTTTTYTVSARSPGAPCFAYDTITIAVTSGSLYDITPDQTITYGSSVQLNADSSWVYMWTPDDGSLSNANINNPVATPLKQTTYTVYGIDRNGCRANASVTISLTYGNIFIPDAFTPNGDGLNDFFRIGNLGFYKIDQFSVYNRWGQMVYNLEGGGENKGWDGTYGGTLQDMGVYNYLIILTGPNGIQQTYKGNVTLIR